MPPLSHVTLYQDRAGEWRWRLKARNGKVVADSAEGYHSRANAERAWRRFKRLVSAAGG